MVDRQIFGPITFYNVKEAFIVIVIINLFRSLPFVGGIKKEIRTKSHTTTSLKAMYRTSI